MEVYNTSDLKTSRSRPERRGVSTRTVIDAAKERVPLTDLVAHLGGDLRQSGSQQTCLCPLPDHDEKTPSFFVDPAKGVFYCHGCSRGGDVVELARLAWGYPEGGRGAAEAAAYLLMEFGHDVPQRPQSWFGKRERQQRVRDEIDRMRRERVQRRMFRWLAVPVLRMIEDDEEREEEERRLWRWSGDLARLLTLDIERRMGERG